MIKILQAGRFLAAMGVVVCHAAITVDNHIGGVPDVVWGILVQGYLGIDFFFVLSGFIIHFTMQRSKKSMTTFLRDRFIRIMLPYWPVALILAGTYTFFPILSSAPIGWNPWNWISTITLFPTSGTSALSVAWTLQHELIFYFIYAILLFFNKLKVGIIIWASLIVVLTISNANVWPILQLSLDKLNLEFIFGIIAADLVLRSYNFKSSASVSIALALFLLFIFSGNRLLFGCAIAAVLPWVCNLEAKGKLHIPEVFVFGGAISYSIYLIHNPLLSLTSRIMHFLSFSWIEAIILSVIFSAFAGSAYFLIWEKPMMKKTKILIINFLKKY